MNEILSKLAQYVEFGKINKTSSYPPNMKDRDVSNELTKKAFENGINQQRFLQMHYPCSG